MGLSFELFELTNLKARLIRILVYLSYIAKLNILIDI